MTSDDDFRRQLEDYLETYEGSTPLPDRVRDAVAAELPGTRQVRRGPMKGTPMSSSLARWGLLAACLVVAVGVGSALLLPGTGPGTGGVVATPTIAPTPTSSPSPVPSVSATPTAAGPVALAIAPHAICPDSTRGEQCVQPGTYLIGSALPGGLVDVPPGWFVYEPGSGAMGLLVQRDDAEAGSGWGVVVMHVGDVSRDPCDRDAGTLPAGEIDTPEALIAAMASWPGFQATPAEPTTVAGVDGLSTILTTTNAPEACAAPVIWETAAGIPVDGYPMVNGAGSEPGTRYPAEFRIIAVDGQLYAVRTMASAATSPFEREQGIADDPERHETEVAVLEGIVESLRFEDAGG